MSSINDNFQYLNIGMAEDILRYKTIGDFESATRLINLKLSKPLPLAMKKCLEAELEIIKRLPIDYPYTTEEAIKLIQKDIPDFTKEEFCALVDDNKIDWIFVNSEPHYLSSFYRNLLNINKSIHDRANKNKEQVVKERATDRAIRIMRTNGKIAFSIHIKASVKIKDEFFEPGKKVRVHIPIPAQAKQISHIELLSFSSEPTFISPDNATQRTVYWEEVMEKNHEFFVEYKYENTCVYVDPVDDIVENSHPNFFLEEEPPHIVFTPYIKELVHILTGDLTNPLQKARRIYDYITSTVTYSFMREYFGLENIADNCAKNHLGDCGVQVLLFITMCRYAGIPAKWQSGLFTSPDEINGHDWAEFYVEPFGWLFADPSFGGGAFRDGNDIRRNFYFGNLDPFRMVANRKFYSPIEPEKKFWRADPYDNQVGEIEFEDRGLMYNEFTRKQEMLSIKEIELKDYHERIK